jgi:hypothetical protein
MRRKRTAAVSLAMGAMVLMLLLAAACKPSLPSVDLESLPVQMPTSITLPTVPLLPTPKIGDKEIVMPTIPPLDIVPIGPDDDKMVAVAKADLAQRLGVADEDIVVKSVEEKEWPDTSLGCPQEGMRYLQVITPGLRIVLTVAGQDYEYHTDLIRAVLCSPQLP